MTSHVRKLRLGLSALAGMLCLLLLAGCQTNPKQLREFLQEAHTPVGSTEYRVLPPDVLTISAKPAEEFNNLVVQLGPDGRGTLPLLGEVQLADKTVTEIAAELTELLKKYYQGVRVTVTVREYNSQKFFVFGQVTRPGAYAYTGSDSLLSALAAAQPTNLAMPEQIQLVRGDNPTQGGVMPPEDPKDKPKVSGRKLTVNLWEMVNQGDMSANVLLARNDVIYVPPNPLAAVGLMVQNLLFPVRPAAETAITPARVAGGMP